MNGLVKPSKFFRENIEPNYQSFISDVKSEWKMWNAICALHRHLEWTFHYYDRIDKNRLPGRKNLNDFFSDLVSQCPEIQMISELRQMREHRFIHAQYIIPRIHTTATSVMEEYRGNFYAPAYGQADLPANVLDAIRAVHKFWQNWPD